MTTTQAENDKFTKENASLIRVIGKLSNKVHKPRWEAKSSLLDFSQQVRMS